MTANSHRAILCDRDGSQQDWLHDSRGPAQNENTEPLAQPAGKAP